MSLLRKASFLSVGFLLVSLGAAAAELDPVTGEMLARVRSSFVKDHATKASMNAIRNPANNINDLSLDFDVLNACDGEFSHVIRREGVTDQKSSGRCWLFAGLNLLRYRVGKKLEQPNFELSQTYNFFWHKFESANTFLELVIATRDLDHTDPEFRWLVTNTMADGGYWNMATSLIRKYGVVPASVMPETAGSENTAQMNRILENLVKSYADEIRTMAAEGKSLRAMRERKVKALQDVYRVLAMTLGEPPQSFMWRYQDKSKNGKGNGAEADSTETKEADDPPVKITPLTPFARYTPQSFLDEFVGTDLPELVRVCHDPTRDYFERYRIKWTTNTVEDTEDTFINVPMDDLIDLTKRSILDGTPVYFAADVSFQRNWKEGFMAEGLYDYDSLFGIDLSTSRPARMRTYSTAANHAMVFVGMDLADEDAEPTLWLVENSWGGEKSKNKEGGYFKMRTDWFREYVFEVTVDKALLTVDMLEALDREPVELRPWDPLWDGGDGR